MADPTRLLVNEVGNGSGWLGLVTRWAGTRDALGSRAMVRTEAGQEVWRRVATDGSFASSGDPRVLWGLGSAERVEALEVRWLDGSRSRYRNVDAGAYLVVPGPGGD